MIEVKIQPIARSRLTNVYELVVKSMHGDADAYTTKRNISKSVDKLIKKLAVFDAVFNLGWNNACDNNEVLAAIKSVDFIEGEDVTDFYSDMVGYDMVYNGDYASPDSLNVCYYNNEGIIHDCEISGMKISRS